MTKKTKKSKSSTKAPRRRKEFDPYYSNLNDVRFAAADLYLKALSAHKKAMNERKFTVKIVPPEHSMDRWRIGLEKRRPSGDYSFEVAVAETKAEAIANAKAALLDALKQLEEK